MMTGVTIGLVKRALDYSAFFFPAHSTHNSLNLPPRNKAIEPL